MRAFVLLSILASLVSSHLTNTKIITSSHADTFSTKQIAVLAAKKKKKKKIQTKVVKDKNCKNLLSFFGISVKNKSPFDVMIIINGDHYSDNSIISANTKTFTLTNSISNNSLGANGDRLEFSFVAVDRFGNQIPGKKVVNKSYSVKPAPRCALGLQFTIGEKVFGKKDADTFFVYAAYIQPGQYTCCLNSDGTPTYKFLYGLQDSMPLNAIPLATGFSSFDALLAWACNRPIYFHYWASNWAKIYSYTVSSLPCQINS